jgi:hypothetical protein
MTDRVLESTDWDEREEQADDAGLADDGAAPPGKQRRGTGQPFASGVSGNPAGRPRKRMATGAPGDRLPGSDQPTRALILEEAYRLVTVRDGDVETMMTASRAMLRSLTEAALKGDTNAKRRWTAMVREAELEQKRDQIALYNLMERPMYPREGGASYEDEILVDRSTGTSMVRGGVSEGSDGV